jgi:diguanylate cyclase (GGDEF)-like protein/PAS domain S-box-containing protein
MGAQNRPEAISGVELGFDAALRRALVDSRQRYKDLLELAADLVWETDAEGRFVFLRPDRVLGFSSEALLGTEVRALVPDRVLPGVFAAREPVRGVDVWLRADDGEVRCLGAAALPVFDEEGRWIGARGVCRDVTADRARERSVAETGTRERLAAHFLQILRDEPDPREALRRGLAALVHALGAAGGRILMQGEEAPIAVGEGGAEHAVRAIRWAGRALGTLEFWRATPFGDGDRQLLADAEIQVAGALAHAEAQQRLVALARIDDRTQLLNRRAFIDEMKRRAPLRGVLLYLDLDGFKAINDGLGHAAGDAVLAEVGEALRDGTRPDDLAARLGGDEFAVWFDGATPAATASMAGRLREAIRAAGRRIGGVAASLDVSIGLAGTGADVETLLGKADAAMYAAKRAGRGLLREAVG